jgi:hypothetical protein
MSLAGDQGASRLLTGETVQPDAPQPPEDIVHNINGFLLFRLFSVQEPQLHDIDLLAKMVDLALDGMYPAKSASRFADIIAICVQVHFLLLT